MEHKYRPISMELKYPGIKFKSAQRRSYVCVMAKDMTSDSMESIHVSRRQLHFEENNDTDENYDIVNQFGLNNLNSSKDLGRIHSSMSNEMIPAIDMEFENEEKAWEFYLAYAKPVGFGVRRSKSHKDKYGNLVDRTFCCSAQGKRGKDKRDFNVKSHRPETRFGCQARMRVHTRYSSKFRVIEFVQEHNHYLSSPRKTHLHRSHRKVTPPLLAADIEMANNVGIAPKAAHELMARKAGGRENISFPRWLEMADKKVPSQGGLDKVADQKVETENQSSLTYEKKGKAKVGDGSQSEIEYVESTCIEKEGVKKARCCEEDCNHKQITATLKELRNSVNEVYKKVAANKGEQQPSKWPEWLSKAILMAGGVLVLCFEGKKVGKKFDEALHELKAAKKSWESAGCPSPIALNPKFDVNLNFTLFHLGEGSRSSKRNEGETSGSSKGAGGEAQS